METIQERIEHELSCTKKSLELNQRYRKALITRGDQTAERALIAAGMSPMGADELVRGPAPLLELLTRNIARLRRQSNRLQRQLRGLERWAERNAS